MQASAGHSRWSAIPAVTDAGVRQETMEPKDFRKIDLEEYTFPGTDAAVLVVKQKVPQAELEKSFGELSGDHRFYPTETGWEIKFPYWYVEKLLSQGDCGITIQDVKREAKGWDHEHCSFCHAHIHIGDASYTHPHEEGGVYIICPDCAKKCG